MENRRNFFKGIALFVSGVVTSRINAMVPKQEEKEELMVSEHIVINNYGEEYHPVVVKKKAKIKGDLSNIPRNNGIISPLDLKKAPTSNSSSYTTQTISVKTPEQSKVRKLKQ